MSGTDVTNTLTDFLGMQILTDDFAKFLIDEDFATEGDFSELFEIEEESEEQETNNGEHQNMMQSSYTLVYLERGNITVNLSECITTKSKEPIHYHINDWFTDCESDAVHTIIEGLKSECEDDGYTEQEVEEFFNDNEDAIRDEIYSRDDSNTLDSVISNTDNLPIRVELHSNYDCINSHHFEGNYSYKESYFGDMVDALNLNPKRVKELFESVDIECVGEFPDLTERDGNEVVSYESFATEISNSVSPANLLTFMAKVDVSELYERGFAVDEITIPKGNSCGLYSASSGGGSLLEMELQRDVTIKIRAEKYDYYSFELDGDSDRGYSIKDVFGVMDSFCGKMVTLPQIEEEVTE